MKAKKMFLYIALGIFTILALRGLFIKHIEMRDKLEPLMAKFEKIAIEKEDLKIRFFGELDQIVNQRNQMLRQNHYVKIGTWTASYGSTSFVIFYIDLSWMSDGIYDYCATLFIHDKDWNFFHYLGAIIFAILLMFSFFCILALFLGKNEKKNEVYIRTR